MTAADTAAIVSARRQLHAVAESFIAGPQYRAHGTIRLAARPDGIAGIAVPVRLHGVRLVWPDGDVLLSGPFSRIAEVSGLDVGPPPATVYRSLAVLGEDAVLDIDPAAADLIYRALCAGDVAVKRLAPQDDPVLWPEHFDVGAAIDEVNYGVSAGDDFHPLPYAYVGPWTPRAGSFWNAPFGALLPLDPAADVDSLATQVEEFFADARPHL